jgi:hypothetical protein
MPQCKLSQRRECQHAGTENMYVFILLKFLKIATQELPVKRYVLSLLNLVGCE